jgi:polyhydroxyalkanoate synthesis regulator phasin
MARSARVWDVTGMVDFESLADRLAGGGQSLAQSLAQALAQSLGTAARGEARRVLDVLVERGDLSLAEADEIETAVAGAAETQRRWIDENVLSPLGRALRGVANSAAPSAESGALHDRLAAIEARLERIERALAKRDDTKR